MLRSGGNPKYWFREHALHADDRRCGCSEEVPGKGCDVGQALIRVAIQHGATHVHPARKAA